MDKNIKQRPVPSPDASKWREAGWQVRYELGSNGYRPGLPNGEKKQPPVIKGG